MTTLHDLLMTTLYEAISPNFEVTFADGYGPAAAALLALFDVEEQWGLTWPTGAGDPDWFDTEADARVSLSFRATQAPDLAKRTELLHRFVLTTKPEPTAGATP